MEIPKFKKKKPSYLLAVVCDLCYQELKWEMETHLPNKLNPAVHLCGFPMIYISKKKYKKKKRFHTSVPQMCSGPQDQLVRVCGSFDSAPPGAPVCSGFLLARRCSGLRTLVTRHPGQLTRSFSFLSRSAPSLCSELRWPGWTSQSLAESLMALINVQKLIPFLNLSF